MKRAQRCELQEEVSSSRLQEEVSEQAAAMEGGSERRGRGRVGERGRGTGRRRSAEEFELGSKWTGAYVKRPKSRLVRSSYLNHASALRVSRVRAPRYGCCAASPSRRRGQPPDRQRHTRTRPTLIRCSHANRSTRARACDARPPARARRYAPRACNRACTLARA
eukprot:6186709-Pleurochrysis_carterae.AAC.1